MDTINRSDAIKALRKLGHEVVVVDKVCSLGVATEFIDVIRTVPSADRPQGEWETVGKNHPYKRCPFCKRVRAFTDTRFCDWCGARMKGADDESTL